MAFLVFQGRRSGKAPRWCRANPSYGLAAPGRNRKSNEWHDKRLVLLVWSLLIAIRARYRFSIPHTVEIADSGSFLISPLLLKIGRRTPGNLFLFCLPRCDLDSRCRCNLQGASSHSSFRVSVHIPTHSQRQKQGHHAEDASTRAEQIEATTTDPTPVIACDLLHWQRPSRQTAPSPASPVLSPHAASPRPIAC